jgi:hypothetical protein
VGNALINMKKWFDKKNMKTKNITKSLAPSGMIATKMKRRSLTHKKYENEK